MGIRTWFERRFRIEELLHSVAHDFREFALLWLVFSMLDKLINDSLTTSWVAGNAAFGFAVWLFGAYLEFRRR